MSDKAIQSYIHEIAELQQGNLQLQDDYAVICAKLDIAVELLEWIQKHTYWKDCCESHDECHPTGCVEHAVNKALTKIKEIK